MPAANQGVALGSGPPLPILGAVGRFQRAFLPHFPVLLLSLEPGEEAGGCAEGTELDDYLPVLRILGVEEVAALLVDHVRRLLEGDLVVALPFLPPGEVEPRVVQEQDALPRLPRPSEPERGDQGSRAGGRQAHAEFLET